MQVQFLVDCHIVLYLVDAADSARFNEVKAVAIYSIILKIRTCNI